MPESIEHIESLINQGRYIEARIKSEDALKTSQELRYKQLYALALSKCGMPETALAFLEPVYAQFPNDPESAGILGSIYKELFKKNQSNSFAVKSRDTYFQNFSLTKSYYTGINAASMTAMAGQAARSREIASEVIALIEHDAANDFWKLATLGEAYVLTKNRAKSTEFFVEARKLAGNDWGKVISVYNQLWLLNNFVPVSGEVMKMFNPPVVMAFVGHMIDHPNRSTPRFPASIEPQIKSAILNSLRSSNARIGYCSLACGGDILFAECLEELGGEVNIFLPFAEADFIKQSVAFAGEDWVNRYNRLINKFPVTYITHEPYAGLDDLFAFQNKVICGSAVLRSAAHQADPTLLTVLSAVDLKRKQGGTRDTINVWPYPKNYININPDTFVTAQPVPQAETQSQPKSERLDRPVLFLVQVNTESVPAMALTKLLKDVDAKILDESISFTSYKANETSLLAGFDMESSAMEFVELILESLKNSNVQSLAKVSLSAGPVFVEAKSNALNKDITGESVELIRQMDALVTPGTVLASDHFASVLALESKKYTIDYSGVLTSKDQKSRNVYTVKAKTR